MLFADKTGIGKFMKRIFYCLALKLTVISALAFTTNIQEVLKQEKYPAVTIPFVAKAPQIDGLITEEEWSRACRVEGFMKTVTWIEKREGVFWITSDDSNLYVAVKSEVHPDGLLAKVKPETEKDDLVLDMTV